MRKVMENLLRRELALPHFGLLSLPKVWPRVLTLSITGRWLDSDSGTRALGAGSDNKYSWSAAPSTPCSGDDT